MVQCACPSPLLPYPNGKWRCSKDLTPSLPGDATSRHLTSQCDLEGLARRPAQGCPHPCPVEQPGTSRPISCLSLSLNHRGKDPSESPVRSLFMPCPLALAVVTVDFLYL